MVEASFSDVLEVILIFLLIYFGFRVFIRWFGPLILRYFLKKIGKKFEKSFHTSWQQTPGQGRNAASRNKHKEEVEIQNPQPNKRPKSRKDVGEYIDYEEID